MNGVTDTFHKPFRGNLYHNYSISPEKSQRLVLTRRKICAACYVMRKTFVKSNNNRLTLIVFADFFANSDLPPIVGYCALSAWFSAMNAHFSGRIVNQRSVITFSNNPAKNVLHLRHNSDIISNAGFQSESSLSKKYDMQATVPGNRFTGWLHPAVRIRPDAPPCTGQAPPPPSGRTGCRGVPYNTAPCAFPARACWSRADPGAARGTRSSRAPP